MTINGISPGRRDAAADKEGGGWAGGIGSAKMFQQDVKVASILIADDAPEIRAVLHEFLGRTYQCASVDSAEAALAQLAGRKFNLLISDIGMPGMSGLQLVPHVREYAPEAVVILITGAHTLEYAVEAMRAGAFDYLLKPFDLRQVEVAVGRALDHQRLLEEKLHRENYLREQIKERTAELDGALRSLEGAYRTTLKALIAALETRDRDTHGHCERVVSFSLRLGREMGLDEERLRSLEFGSLLHDIGKIGVPDAVLRKPGRLTEEEWACMRWHPILGQQILSDIGFLEGAARVVAQHHERWDGYGYPKGLRGEEIDLNARIFAVADAFDAITSDRVYRNGNPYEVAAAELEKCAGCQFDPRVVEAFRRVPAEEWERLRGRPPREGFPGAGAALRRQTRSFTAFG